MTELSPSAGTPSLAARASQIGAEPKHRPRANAVQQGRERWGWLFLMPWIIGFFAFTLLPIVASLVFSLTEFTLTEPENIRFIGLANYQRMLEDPTVRVSLLNTLKFAAFALPLAIGVPVGLAALLNSEYLIGKRVFRTLFYLPYIVPLVSAIYIWSGMLNTETGWLNRALESIGVPGPNWLFSTTWIYPALNIIGLWGVGNAMLVTLSGMQGVPTELYEAAKVDGANGWTRFFRITVPMISPVIFYNLVLAVIGLFRYFEVPWILKEGTGDPGNSTLFINLYFYKNAFTFQNMGYGATLAWLIFGLAFVATLLLFATSRLWVYYAAGEQR